MEKLRHYLTQGFYLCRPAPVLKRVNLCLHIGLIFFLRLALLDPRQAITNQFLLGVTAKILLVPWVTQRIYWMIKVMKKMRPLERAEAVLKLLMKSMSSSILQQLPSSLYPISLIILLSFLMTWINFLSPASLIQQKGVRGSYFTGNFLLSTF